MSFLLVGCGRSEKIKDADEEVKVNAHWDIIQFEFGDYSYTFDEASIGFDILASNSCLDRLGKLDYADEYDSDFNYGDPFIQIKITEDGENLTYSVFEDYVLYYSDVEYVSYYSNYTQKDFNELISAILPIIGDNHYFAEESGDFSVEVTEGIVCGQENYYDIASKDTYAEGYYVTGDAEGEYICSRDVSKNFLYYMEWKFNINSLDLPDTVYFYDLMTDGEKGFERHSEVAKWYEADMNTLDMPPLILDDIFAGMDCEESYNISTANSEFLKGVYKNSDKICVAYFMGEGIKTVFYEDGQILFGEYYISINGGLSADEMAEDMETFSSTLDDYDEEEFAYSYSFNEANRFDFDAPREKGDTIDNPHIVEDYRDFFDTAEEFTLYTTSKRADGYMEYSYVTMSGPNYYYESGGQMYGEKALIHNEVLFDGMLYYDVHEEGEEPEYKAEYPVDDIYDRPFTIGVLQYDYTGLGDDEFQTAYYVTINGEEYICELWLCGVTDVYVFSKDREVVAIEAHYGVGKEQQVIEYLTTDADEEKITPPLQADVVE